MNKHNHNQSRNVSFSIDMKGANTSFLPSVNHEDHFNPKDYVMPGADERDVIIFKEVFDMLDIDGNNLLTPMELRNGMTKLGFNPKKQFVYQLLSDLDTDECGYLGFYDFIKFMTTKNPNPNTVEDVERLFKEFDVDGKGYIDRNDIKRIATSTGEQVTEDLIEQMMLGVDPDGDGKISIKEWTQFMMKQ
jgi:Ca2+-binding EF-hand superfamily protein